MLAPADITTALSGCSAADLAQWVDKLHDMVERHQGACYITRSLVLSHTRITPSIDLYSFLCGSLLLVRVYILARSSFTESLEAVPMREKVATRVSQALEIVVAALAETTFDAPATTKLLATCKVLMRDRRGIDALLTVETFERFFRLAEVTSATASDWRMGEEALKCAINSVYARPEFIEKHMFARMHLHRLLVLAERRGPASFHVLVWKCVLVSSEAPSVVAALCQSPEIWQLLYATLFFSFHGESLIALPAASDRVALVLDLLKLLAVLVNAMAWTKDAEDAQPTIYNTVHRLGELLLSMLCVSPPAHSPLHETLLDVKNKALEVFMFLPAELLAAFIATQSRQLDNAADGSDTSDSPALTALVEHLCVMLLATRVEKTRELSEMLPTLIVCHTITQSASPAVTAYFQQRVLPPLPPMPLHAAAAVATSPASVSATASSRDRQTQFYFAHLLFFLTCLDTDVRRVAGEWLYLLCNEDADEYTRRTGLGNAIGMLRIKGLA